MSEGYFVQIVFLLFNVFFLHEKGIFICLPAVIG
jgi:hypothetical protein